MNEPMPNAVDRRPSVSDALHANTAPAIPRTTGKEQGVIASRSVWNGGVKPEAHAIPSRFTVPCSVFHLESAKRRLYFIIGATFSMALASIAAALVLVYWD